jgi:threonine/homoserine/homoserine lactone efflux protein
MAFETWAAFAAASIALSLIPGPTILPVIGQSRGAGLATASLRRA